MSPATELLNILRDFLPKKKESFSLHEPFLGKREIEEVSNCLREGYVSSVGSRITTFENKLAELLGVKHVICLSSGTTALHVLLHSLGVSASQEVICPSLTFVGTANAVVQAGATPHFVDCEEKTLAIDPPKLEEYLKKTLIFSKGKWINRHTDRPVSAIIVVHVFGHSASIKELQRLAENYNLPLIEDAAEALGSTCSKKALGTIGKAGILSFNGNKIITTGGGGAVLTNDDELAEKIRHLSTTAKKPHSWEFYHDAAAFNYRMPNLNAALGLAQLTRLPEFIAHKKRIAKCYSELFSEAKNWDFIQPKKECESNYWLNGVKLKSTNRKQREETLDLVNKNKIHCRPLWTPLHKLPMYQHNPRATLTCTESMFDRVINLPSSPNLLEDFND